MSNTKPTAPPSEINPPDYSQNQSGYQPMQYNNMPPQQQQQTQPQYQQPQQNTQTAQQAPQNPQYQPPVYQQQTQQQQQQQLPPSNAPAYNNTGYPLYPQVQPSTAQVNYIPPQQQQPQPQPQYQQPQQYPQNPQFQQPQYGPPQGGFVISNSLYNPKNGTPGMISLPQPQVQQTTTKKKGGMFSSLTKTLETGINSLAHEVDKALTNQALCSDKGANDRFRKHFSLPPHEGLFFEVPSKAATFDTVLIGHLYLSYSYLSFYCEFTGQKAHVLIPLRDIIAVQRAMVGKSVKETHPNIVPYNPHECKLVDNYVIEIYTNIGKVHQFFSIANYEHTYQQIESVWRNCNKMNTPPMPTTVMMHPNQPQPQPQYQQQPTPQQQPQYQQQPQPHYQQPPQQIHQTHPTSHATVYTTTTTTTTVKPVVQNPPVLYPNSNKK